MRTDAQRERKRMATYAWRARNPERSREIYKTYSIKRLERKRVERFSGQRCRNPDCEILLSDKLWGAHGTKYYCRGCVDRGLAQKHMHREATRRWREKNLTTI